MKFKKIIPVLLILLVVGLIAFYLYSNNNKTEQTSSNSVAKVEEKQIENTSNEIIAENTTTEQAVEAKTKPEEKLSQMSLEEKIGQLFIVRPDSLGSKTELSEETKNLLEQYPVGGIALFSQNIENPEQLKKFTSDFQNSSKIPLFIGIDEEGGSVARIAKSENFDVPKYENMASIGATGDATNAYNVGKTIGEYLKEYGINLDFAPIADVNTNPNNPVIRQKSFWK